MFKNQAAHEMGIKKELIENTRKTKLAFSQRKTLKVRGAKWHHEQRRLNRKISRCYPRGKAWLRMVDLHTVAWLSSH